MDRKREKSVLIIERTYTNLVPYNEQSGMVSGRRFAASDIFGQQVPKSSQDAIYKLLKLLRFFIDQLVSNLLFIRFKETTTMANLNRRALSYVVTISLVSNPAGASILTDALEAGKSRLSRWMGKEAKPATVPVARTATDSTHTFSQIRHFKDDLEKASGGVFKSLALRVSKNLYYKTLGRTDELTRYLAEMENPNSMGVALMGIEGPETIGYLRSVIVALAVGGVLIAAARLVKDIIRALARVMIRRWNINDEVAMFIGTAIVVAALSALARYTRAH
jgi:hypothetical protein